VFHFHPLSIEDCATANKSPKVEEYSPKEGDLFTPYLFMVIHAVDYSRQNGQFATSELDFFLGRNFLVTYHRQPLRSVVLVEERPQLGAYEIGVPLIDPHAPVSEERIGFLRQGQEGEGLVAPDVEGPDDDRAASRFPGQTGESGELLLLAGRFRAAH
jgi:magnesium transporter